MIRNYLYLYPFFKPKKVEKLLFRTNIRTIVKFPAAIAKKNSTHPHSGARPKQIQYQIDSRSWVEKDRVLTNLAHKRTPPRKFNVDEETKKENLKALDNYPGNNKIECKLTNTVTLENPISNDPSDPGPIKHKIGATQSCSFYNNPEKCPMFAGIRRIGYHWCESCIEKPLKTLSFTRNPGSSEVLKERDQKLITPLHRGLVKNLEKNEAQGVIMEMNDVCLSKEVFTHEPVKLDDDVAQAVSIRAVQALTIKDEK